MIMKNIQLPEVKIRPIMVEDYHNKFCYEVNQEFAIYVYDNITFPGISSGWHKFKINYIRLDILFISFESNPLREYWITSDSIMSKRLIPLEVYLRDVNVDDRLYENNKIIKGDDFPFIITIHKNSGEIIQI